MTDTLQQANRDLAAGKLDDAFAAYTTAVVSDVTLPPERRVEAAVAHLGRAAVWVQRQATEKAEADIQAAGIIYAETGADDTANTIKQLAGYYHTAIHEQGSKMTTLLERLAEQCETIEPPLLSETVCLLVQAILDTVDHHKPMIPPERDLL